MEKVEKLGQRQVFTIKRRDTLEKRFNSYFKETQDAIHVIYWAIALLVRNGLSASNFSFIAKDLIRSLFLENDDVRAIPLSCIYFRDYFNDAEWQVIINRLFSSQEEFTQLTESTRLYIENLRPLLNSGEQPTNTKTNMISFFKDANGKRHSWNLSNVNPSITKEQHYALLSILGTLDIFEKDGVRRFVEPIYADFLVYKSGFDSRTEEELTTLQAHPGKLLPVNTKEIETVASEEILNEERTADQQPETASAEEAQKEQEIQAKREFLLKDFDRSTVPEEELPNLAMKAILEDKSLREVQLEMQQEQVQAGKEQQAENPSPKKPLSTKERFKQLLEQKQRTTYGRQGLINQINKRGKKRK